MFLQVAEKSCKCEVLILEHLDGDFLIHTLTLEHKEARFGKGPWGEGGEGYVTLARMVWGNYSFPRLK